MLKVPPRVRTINHALAHRAQGTPRAAVEVDAVHVNADAQTPVRIHGIVFGSTVRILGPETDTFMVTDDTITLAFAVPGRYRITVEAPDRTEPVNAEITAL